jgi:parallel beta helix pectate lyase-like protein
MKSQFFVDAFQSMISSTIPKSFLTTFGRCGSFVVALLMFSAIANAATITVTTRLDPAGPSGTCSLRQAIMNANGNNHSGSQDCTAGSGTDTIVFSTQDNIILTSALPAITQSLNIVSNVPGKSISGGTRLRIFTVNPNVTLTIKNLLLFDADSILEGSAIDNRGNLLVENCQFENNGASAIFDETGSTATITGSAFTGTKGRAVEDWGTLSVATTTFSNNSGGGIFTKHIATVSQTLFDGNGAPDVRGGGISNDSGSLTIVNSTFSRNTAVFGGAISSDCPTPALNRLFGNPRNAPACGTLIINSTIADNRADTAGGGLFALRGVIKTHAVIFSANTSQPGAGANCVVYNSPQGDGYDIADDSSCKFGHHTGAGGQPTGDDIAPLLSTAGLQDNDGPTKTIALQPSSPAVDAIPLAKCLDQSGQRLTIDQRGFGRPDPADPNACDTGAFEFGAEPPP